MAKGKCPHCGRYGLHTTDLPGMKKCSECGGAVISKKGYENLAKRYGHGVKK